jgi:DNA-binding transcriptional regulator YiaG
MAMPPEPDDIRSARMAAGLTQTEASDMVHASLRAWQQWEAGDRKMHPGLFELFNLKTGRRASTRPASDGKNRE